MRARAMMVAGTASHVGKSWMATAICRYLSRQGLKVAPFKAQNMSNNSYPCLGGGEIGRAQVAQAEACFLAPEPDMNPILLKPNSDTGSQVIVNGKVWKTLSGRDYYAEFPFLLQQVLDSFERLSRRFDFIIMEGAGSISELNLKQTDLVNLGLATRVAAPVLLVADIDRGGVFASVTGTFNLLDSSESPLVRAFVINRFRGDPALFSSGVATLEEQTRRPCLGVFPHLPDTLLDPEDGVGWNRDSSSESDVAIIAFPHASNLSDFRLLPTAHRITKPGSTPFRTIILPGTKNTIGDLQWLNKTGLSDWILQQHRHGATIIGVCGGYQMLGESIADPTGMESTTTSIRGLHLLPVQTVLNENKLVRSIDATMASGYRFSAYEIHLGQTTRPAHMPPFALLSDGTEDGARGNRCIGTYLHGALENAFVLSELLGRSISPAPSRESTYGALADWFATHADLLRFEELYLCR